ncbi:MAG: hypothetical protein K0M60_13485 [Hydrogenophaga sp.]|nr:hypothetical protein [Hydrogenophaga sp.]
MKEFCGGVGISLAKGRYSGDSAIPAEIEMPKNLHSFIAIRGKWPILQASKIASVFVYAPRRTSDFLSTSIKPDEYLTGEPND